MRLGFTTGIVATLALAASMMIGATTASADSASPWKPCEFAEVAYDCANFDMPLDRTGVLGGTTTVRATRLSASEGPRMGTLFVIAGGPGQTAQVMLGLMADEFGGANRYDVVAVDQRGSGTSEPLNCPRLESMSFNWVPDDPKTDTPFTDCSVSLSAARSSYNTAEAVADLDAVRSQLGVDKATFFGVSYGTKVALAYAQAHPDHTKGLIIDSTLPTDEPSSFDTESMAAARGALQRICNGNRCKGIGNSPVSNMAKLASRLEKKPIDTFLVDSTGKISESKIDAIALSDILFSADLNPFIYNQIPGMLTESLRGDTAQLERLYGVVNGATDAATRAEARRIAKLQPKKKKSVSPTTSKPGDRVIGRDATDLANFSNTMFFATTCADLIPPWTRSDNVSNRQASIVAAANAIPDSAFYPFLRNTVRDNSTATYCRGWQQNPTPPAIVQGPLPNVPTLALNGNLDLRTPTTWAQKAIAGDPSAQLVQIPNTGHSVVGTDISGCALSLAKRFLIFGATDGKCKSTSPAIPIAPLPPASLRKVHTPNGTCRGIRGARCSSAKRALEAGYLAMRDTLDQLLIGGMDAGAGLRDGVWEVEYDIDDNFNLIPVDLKMTGVSNVPGVYTSGKLNLEDSPRIDETLRMGGWHVDTTGRIAYDRSGDQLTLAGRRGRARVTVHIKPRGGTRAAPLAVSAKTLKLRRNYMLATNPSAADALFR